MQKDLNKAKFNNKAERFSSVDMRIAAKLSQTYSKYFPPTMAYLNN